MSEVYNFAHSTLQGQHNTWEKQAGGQKGYLEDITR